MIERVPRLFEQRDVWNHKVEGGPGVSPFHRDGIRGSIPAWLTSLRSVFSRRLSAALSA